jgi:hypothetical protein
LTKDLVNPPCIFRRLGGLSTQSFQARGSVNRYVRVRFEVFAAVTMKNGVFWDIKTQFVLHRGHITSPLQSPTS